MTYGRQKQRGLEKIDESGKEQIIYKCRSQVEKRDRIKRIQRRNTEEKKRKTGRNNGRAMEWEK